MVNIQNDYDYIHIYFDSEDPFFEQSDYQYNGYTVPRVTKIIEATRDQSGLINWAAKMNYGVYKNIKEKALQVGTVVHEAIDKYVEFMVNGGQMPDTFQLYQGIPDSYIPDIEKAYNNFKNWLAKFQYHGYTITRILGTEVPLSCPSYGGTADMIVQINNQWNYILDFKTSKEISYGYILQLVAYEMIINSGFYPEINHIDGVGIIRVDKKNDISEDLFIQSNNIIMDDYRRCFLSMVETYYRTFSTNQISSSYIDIYNLDEVMRGN